jgi:hypothetical protein
LQQLYSFIQDYFKVCGCMLLPSPPPLQLWEGLGNAGYVSDIVSRRFSVHAIFAFGWSGPRVGCGSKSIFACGTEMFKTDSGRSSLFVTLFILFRIHQVLLY